MNFTTLKNTVKTILDYLAFLFVLTVFCYSLYKILVILHLIRPFLPL